MKNSRRPSADKNCPICKGAGFVHPRLPSGKPDFSRVVSCRCVKAAIEKDQENRLQKYSNLGSLASYNFESHGQKRPQRRCRSGRNYLRKPLKRPDYLLLTPKGWFILVGPSGSGKTYLAAAIANERIKQGQPAFFQTVPEFAGPSAFRFCSRQRNAL